MQLVAYGAQDIYLTGNPQITFFKVVYRRHTNFSMETIQQTLNGTSTIAATATTATCTISRNGDLVHKVYVTSNDTQAVTDGSKIVSEVEIEIGGQRIDRHYAEWNDVWNELSTPTSKSSALKAMQCAIGTRDGDGVSLIQIPLNFWFCRNPGLALPLIALQYHEVKLKFTWGLSTEVGASATILPTMEVWCDYIYLDTDERRRFAQVSHEYLIEQVQKQTATASTTSKLNFNHPVKELIWVTPNSNAYTTARLVLNGHDRFADQEEEYFQLRQPFDYHTTVPAQNLPDLAFITEMGSHVENITSGPSTGLVHDTHTNGLDLAEITWSAIVGSTGGGTTFTASDDIASGTSTATQFIALGGGDGATGIGGLLKGSLVIGDIHRVVVGDLSGAVATTKSTLARVEAVYVDDAGTAALVDGTGVLVSSHGGAQAATDQYTGSSHTLHANSLAIKYDRLVTTGETLADNDTLIIYKVGDAGCHTSQMTKRINVYSFALKPEEHQPSGTCNFSRIDNAQLVTGSALASTDNIYAVNYNVLRIMSGMGGLAYSN